MRLGSILDYVVWGAGIIAALSGYLPQAITGVLIYIAIVIWHDIQRSKDYEKFYKDDDNVDLN